VDNRLRLRIGDWNVDPTSGLISKNGETARIEARTMRLLVCLAERAGKIVSIEDLLDQVWPGVTVTQDSVYQSVATLRKLLGDDPKQPAYIATVPRLGYRLVATVSRSIGASNEASPRPNPASLIIAGATLCVLCLVGVGIFVFRGPGRDAATPRQAKSIAVLPFQDLTEEMNQEPFADGMTVELIDRLSKVAGLRVHAPMSPAKLKGKTFTIVDMAKMLEVAYVVDGSVRKSGDRLRVGARLLRGDNEYVVWSNTYDRPAGDILTVQDDIAGAVTKALAKFY